MYDLILKNASICDGTDTPAYCGSIAVSDGLIAKIAPEIKDTARRTINAEGLTASPGFIDIHTHADTSFLRDPRNESKIFQGVTSEVMGLCGISNYPALPGHLGDVRSFVGADVAYDKAGCASFSLGEFLGKVASKPMTTNLLPLVGHSALRAGVMGFEARAATDQELRQMAALLDENLAMGAWGLSLGLAYTPGVFSDQEELVAMGHVVKKHNGLVISHIRNQSVRIIEAMDEMFEIYRQSGARVQLTHLKVCQPKCGTSGKVLKYIRAAQAAGIKVTMDMYPYSACETNVADLLPKWALEGGLEAASARLEPGAPDRIRILEDLHGRFKTREDGESVRIMTTYGSDPASDGKTLSQISREKDMPMAEAIADIIRLSKGRAAAVYFIMDEDDVFNFLKEDDISIGSDSENYPYVAGTMTHPRHFGAFPRFLRLVRERKLCSLETAVHRITQLPANQLGITDRGVLREGLAADITVFDPKKVRDTASYDTPCSQPEGFAHVIIGGEFAIVDGAQTDARPGRFILKNHANSRRD